MRVRSKVHHCLEMLTLSLRIWKEIIATLLEIFGGADGYPDNWDNNGLMSLDYVDIEWES